MIQARARGHPYPAWPAPSQQREVCAPHAAANLISARPPRSATSTGAELRRLSARAGWALARLNCIHYVLTISERIQAAVAQKIQTLFIDDLDGSTAGGTVRFGLDGTEYEIDLNAGHAKELRDALARYVDAARRVSGSARKPARSSLLGTAGGLNATEVREWARAQGIEVKDRGRVPADLMVKFKSAAGQQD